MYSYAFYPLLNLLVHCLFVWILSSMQLAGCYYVYHCIFAFFHPELKIESLPANKEYQWKVHQCNFWLTPFLTYLPSGGSTVGPHLCRTFLLARRCQSVQVVPSRTSTPAHTRHQTTHSTPRPIIKVMPAPIKTTCKPKLHN